MSTRDKRYSAVLRVVSRFLLNFLIIAFVVTCSTMLFVQAFSRGMGIELTGHNVGTAAKLTLINTFLLTLILTAVDLIRLHLTVDRPVKRITEAAERMMHGDFSIRLKPTQDDAFGEIIDCFNRMGEELSGVETLRNDFVANVSHEMKTPLTVIRNYARLMEDEGLTAEKRQEYARIITDAARRLSDMMTNILKLNRLENQNIYPEPTLFDLGEQLCECLIAYENVWETRGIEIETDIAEDVTVRADRDLLSLVWNNLLSNAFKFTERGGKVRLSLRADETAATVEVSDTGCGMSGEVGAHMFEKFYQGDTSRATQGNGLGLALVRRVIDITQSEIRVDSAVGRGTTFTVQIGRNL